MDADGNPVQPVVTGVKCEKCGKPMIVKKGPRGPFLACSGYPGCKTNKPLPAELKEKYKDVFPPPPPKKEMPKVEVTETCPNCGSAMKLRPGAAAISRLHEVSQVPWHTRGPAGTARENRRRHQQ